jgi:hypothetical protein
MLDSLLSPRYSEDMSRAVESQASQTTAVEDADDKSDLYPYGWRYVHEAAADGSKKLVELPLTYDDLLDPQEGDFIAEDTVHRQVIDDLIDALKRRYRDAPATAVWSNLKIGRASRDVGRSDGPRRPRPVGRRRRRSRMRSGAPSKRRKYGVQPKPRSSGSEHGSSATGVDGGAARRPSGP